MAKRATKKGFTISFVTLPAIIDLLSSAPHGGGREAGHREQRAAAGADAISQWGCRMTATSATKQHKYLAADGDFSRRVPIEDGGQLGRSCPVCRVCSICGSAPCGTPGFCQMCREVDRKAVAQRRPEHDLPKGWEDMSLGALWERLNNPWRTSQSTIEAILVAVRSRGLAALREPPNLERLRRCDAKAQAEIDRRIDKLFEPGILEQ